MQTKLHSYQESGHSRYTIELGQSQEPEAAEAHRRYYDAAVRDADLMIGILQNLVLQTEESVMSEETTGSSETLPSLTETERAALYDSTD